MPTYRGNRRRKASITGRPLRKRSCTTQKKLIRTIVCIPHSHAKFIDDLGEALAISIPRGRARSELFRKGLVGKLEIFSHWTEFEVYKQISDMFFQCFEPVLDCYTLEFHFLSSIPGLKLLQKPKVNAAFTWDGAAVQANSRGIVYILTDSKHICKSIPESQDFGEEIITERVCTATKYIYKAVTVFR